MRLPPLAHFRCPALICIWSWLRQLQKNLTQAGLWQLNCWIKDDINELLVFCSSEVSSWCYTGGASHPVIFCSVKCFCRAEIWVFTHGITVFCRLCYLNEWFQALQWVYIPLFHSLLPYLKVSCELCDFICQLWKVCVGALHLQIYFIELLKHVTEVCKFHEEVIIVKE